MNRFGYTRAESLDHAFALIQQPGAQWIAGGADLIPLLNDNFPAPSLLVDISRIPDLHTIQADGAGVRLGATVTLHAVAQYPQIAGLYAALAHAIRESASPQVRNMATIGGNLLQQPRCPYFRDLGFACLRRDDQQLCSALEGDTSRHALFGYGEPDSHKTCVAVNPSDSANALVAYDAQVEVRSANGTRRIPVEEFFMAAAVDPRRISVLEPGELITAVILPTQKTPTRGFYVKIRDRAAYEFAIVSATAVVAEDAGKVTHARLVLGGVGWAPHRALAAEAYLLGKSLDDATIAEAARLALEGAQPLPDNAYKIPMAQAAMRRAIAGSIPTPFLMEAHA